VELAGRTAVVTGAGGTVGRTVVQRLVGAGMHVRAVVRRSSVPADPAVAVVRADLDDRDALAAAMRGAQLVVHCAAVLTDDEAECRRTNIAGTRNVVDGFVAAGCERMVHLSTVSVYDYRAGLAFREDHPQWTEPVTWYGYSKAEAERIIAASGIAAAILRPVMVLSMHATSYWGPLALERARASDAPVVTLAELPYVHGDNLAEAVVLAAQTPAAVGRAYNAIDGHGDTRAYLDAVARAIGRPVPELPARAPRATYSGERIRRELGYAPVDRWAEFLAELAAAQSG